MGLKTGINKDIITQKHVAVVTGLHLFIIHNKFRLNLKNILNNIYISPPHILFASLPWPTKCSSAQYLSLKEQQLGLTVSFQMKKYALYSNILIILIVLIVVIDCPRAPNLMLCETLKRRAGGPYLKDKCCSVEVLEEKVKK